MSEYYAVQRTGDNSLAHYGVTGMKWGVRKAISRGNKAALGRQFRKAEKKLAKLEKRGASGKQYAKRAAKLGAAGIALGAVGAHAPTIVNAAHKLGGKIKKKGGKLGSVGTAVQAAASGTSSWAQKTFDIGTVNRPRTIRLKNGKLMTNAGALRIGSMAAGAGLLGAAGYNAYRAATAKRNRTKAAKFKSEMQKAFKGTEYASRISGSNSSTSKPKTKKRRNSART